MIGSAPSVARVCGQSAADDRRHCNSTLLPLAAQRGVTIPQALHPRHQAVELELSRLSGRAFDAVYLEEMAGDHAKALAMFERISTTAADPAFPAWAAQQLPILRKHQAATQSLHAQLTGASPAASPPTR